MAELVIKNLDKLFSGSFRRDVLFKDFLETGQVVVITIV